MTFTEGERQPATRSTTSAPSPSAEPEAPGISAFVNDEAGGIFHTYSAYARGLDAVNGAYQLLDIVPKGRDEDGFSYPMEWGAAQG